MARKPYYTREMLESAAKNLSTSISTQLMMSCFAEAVSSKYESLLDEKDREIAELKAQLKKSAEFIELVQGVQNDSQPHEMLDKYSELVEKSREYYPMAHLDGQFGPDF